MTQRWVETATATDKSANTIEKETWLPPQYAKTGFELQTRDIRSLPKESLSSANKQNK